MKMRKGIDDDHITYLDAGRIAVEEGVTAIALHGRTAAQHYGGTADWEAIARLKEHVPEIPVLGNGDIWSAGDALRMVRETGCDGVVVGRGCLGRPWLFADLVAAFEGRPDDYVRPTLREVADAMVRHATLLGEWIGDESRGVIDFRKHVAWYLKGFAVGSEMRSAARRHLHPGGTAGRAGRAGPGPALAVRRRRPPRPYVRQQPRGAAGRLAEGPLRLRGRRRGRRAGHLRRLISASSAGARTRRRSGSGRGRCPSSTRARRRRAAAPASTASRRSSSAPPGPWRRPSPARPGSWWAR